MRQTDKTPTEKPDPRSKGGTGVLGQDEDTINQPSPDKTSGSNKTSGLPLSATSRSAIDEARQMLDEIAGLDATQRPARPPRRDAGHKVRAILLWPFRAIWSFILFIFAPLRQADFRLLGEMRKFLSNPGHFFWFNRIAPEAASRHFGTTSTDAMTHHARRYGAHMAMLVLAVIVVVFGGFSGLATKINSAYADVPHPEMVDGNLIVTGEGREIYADAVAADSKGFTRRIETMVVKEGETLRSIAQARNVSLETLLYANNLVDPDSELKTGQRIVVPPVTGMLHIANPGDTVGRVAEIYGVDPKVIINFKQNNLDGADSSTVLKPLQEVMVPGGSMPLRSKIYMYTVRSNDTLRSVAEKFGLKVDTLLDNNDLDNGLKPGQQIRILPVDGILYTVKKGDTLDGVARYFSTSPENIIGFKANNVARGIALQTGQSLVVPGGEWPPPPPAVTPTPKPSNVAPASNNANKSAPAVAPPAKQASPAKPAASSSSAAKPAASSSSAAKPAAPAANANAGRATGSMVWPMRGLITTYFGQAIWYGIHKGLDISTSCGTPVVAADGGTVVEAGWSPYGYGITALIDHGGGIRTRYGHFSRIAVSLGQRVAKGQLVGYEGTTGNSTGCHLHFEVLVNGAYTDPLRWLR